MRKLKGLGGNMAVFTELSDEDRQSITAAYGFTSLSSVIGIADGDEPPIDRFALHARRSPRNIDSRRVRTGVRLLHSAPAWRKRTSNVR